MKIVRFCDFEKVQILDEICGERSGGVERELPPFL
jgi:hypothetical protein